MSPVSPRDVERYCLRILSLNKEGKTSFRDLQTVNRRMCETVSEAAKASGFLDDDRITAIAFRKQRSFKRHQRYEVILLPTSLLRGCGCTGFVERIRSSNG
ncbi:hypothetical protein Aduo_001479 [Ancylostoma duodenale]